MVMDLGRVGFECKMRFFKDDPLEIDVRWYDAPPGARWFPTWHRFGNGDLAYVQAQWPGIGQVLDTRKYTSNFLPPPNVTGQDFVGTLEQYQDGTYYPGVPLNCQDDGQCPACGPVAPDCLVFGVLHPTLRLTVLSVTSTKLVPLGFPGMTLILTAGIGGCTYVSPFVGSSVFCTFFFTLSYDKVVSSMRATGVASVDKLTDGQTIHPAFKATWVNFPIQEATACTPDNNEIWDFIVELP